MMKKNEIKVEPSRKSPEIYGNIELGEFHIKGISIPEDAHNFYRPFKEWLLEFVQSDSEKIQGTIELEYFNTSTSSILLDIFRHLEKVNLKKQNNQFFYLQHS